MPTRNISLTPEQDAFVEEALDRGDFVEVDEADLDAYLERLPASATRAAR